MSRLSGSAQPACTIKEIKMSNICRDLAKFTVDSRWEELPSSLVHETKRILMDSVGCILGAQTIDKGKMSLSLGKRLGGNPEATIFGLGDKVSLMTAVLVNGELMFTLDYHNIMSNAHDGTYILPAVLAFAESNGASGQEIILASALGCEISSRLAMAVGQHAVGVMGAGGRIQPQAESQGPRRLGNAYSNFGAAAGAGRLLGLDLNTMNHALGLAGHLCMILTKQRWGNSEVRYLSKYGIPGWQGTGAVMAVLLAEEGYSGDTNVLDGKTGFAHMCGYSEWQPEKITEELGKTWWYLHKLHYKPYPCCAVFHAELDCFIDILQKYQLKPPEIEKVRAWGMASSAHGLFGSDSVENLSSAQFNPRYIFSVAAHGIEVGPAWHDRSTATNPEILDFMKKVTLEMHPAYKNPQAIAPLSSPSKCEVTARGGQVFTLERQFKRGTIGTQMAPTDNDLIKKFRNNAERILTQDKIDRAVNMFMKLDKMDNISPLIKELIK
jgi:2-methylcitrate dehydratase PrpD